MFVRDVGIAKIFSFVSDWKYTTTSLNRCPLDRLFVQVEHILHYRL